MITLINGCHEAAVTLRNKTACDYIYICFPSWSVPTEAITVQGKSCCVWISLPSVNTVLAPGLPEFIREHLNHTEPSCTKGVGREGQINWRRAGACWIIMLHVNRRLASYRFRWGLNKVEGADYWEFWRWVDWEAGRQRLFVEVGSNCVSASCPAIRGLLSSRCRRNCHRQTDLLLISISLSIHMALKREPWKVKWRGN